MKHQLGDVAGGWVEMPDVLPQVQFRAAVDGAIWPIRVEIHVPSSDARPGAPSPEEILLVCEFRGILEFLPPGADRLRVSESSLASPRTFRAGPGGWSPFLEVPITSIALARIESLRNGQEPRFQLWLLGGISRTGPQVQGPRGDLPMGVSVSLPFSVSQAAWTAALAAGGVSHAILVEIPLAGSPPKEFAGVRKALADASSSFERGGVLGWQGCAAAVREALDLWIEIRQPVPPSAPAPTVESRVDAIRVALRNFANEAHHGSMDRWTRADALLALATASALLAREGI